MTRELQTLFTDIRESCDPPLWSKGVGLARNGKIRLANDNSSEHEFLVPDPVTSLTYHVFIYPAELDWNCDCSSDDDPCHHVAAAMIQFKQSNFLKETLLIKDSEDHSAVAYHLTSANQQLILERVLGAENHLIKIRNSLSEVAHMKSLAASLDKLDWEIDSLIKNKLSEEIKRNDWQQIFKLLIKKGVKVIYDDRPISLSAQPVTYQATIQQVEGVYELRVFKSSLIIETLKNGVVRTKGGFAIAHHLDSAHFLQKYVGKLSVFGLREKAQLFGEIIPALKSEEIPLTISIRDSANITNDLPRLVFEAHSSESGVLTLTPRIVYGNPAIATLINDQLVTLDGMQIPQRKKTLEEKYIDKAKSLGFELNQKSSFIGLDAIESVNVIDRAKIPLQGDGAKDYFLVGDLVPSLSVNESGLSCTFHMDRKTQSSGINFPRVFSAWQNGDSVVRLNEGGYAKIPQDWMSLYAKRIEPLLTVKRERAESLLSPENVPQLISLSDELNLCLPEYFDKYKQLVGQVVEAKKYSLPNMNVKFRPYQTDGYHWLRYRQEIGVGALLADDMGLGKTLQSIAILEKGSLIVMPKSLLANWKSEIQKFRPDFTVSLYYGKTRRLDKDIDVTLTSYGTLRSDIEALKEHDWNVVVLDESHIIKNPDSQTTKAVFQLRGKFRLSLTGTPIENRLLDLWSQFQFINPGLLGSREEFSSRFQQSQSGGLECKNEIRALISPFVLRRRKDEVLDDLPEKTEVVLNIELTDYEKSIYDSIKHSGLASVKEKVAQGSGYLEAMEIILRLRQAACHTSLLPGYNNNEMTSSKLELLLEQIDSMVENNHKGLVFSQWTSFLDLIEADLKKKGVEYLRLDGKTVNRAAVVEEFQTNSSKKVFLLSLKAGGVGLNLTAADHVFIMDPWWNPAIESQASDRAHRIGQKNKVIVYRLVVKDSIEEKILQLQELKKLIFNQAIEEDEIDPQASQLSYEDILMLLDS